MDEENDWSIHREAVASEFTTKGIREEEIRNTIEFLPRAPRVDVSSARRTRSKSCLAPSLAIATLIFSATPIGNENAAKPSNDPRHRQPNRPATERGFSVAYASARVRSNPPTVVRFFGDVFSPTLRHRNLGLPAFPDEL